MKAPDDKPETELFPFWTLNEPSCSIFASLLTIMNASLLLVNRAARCIPQLAHGINAPRYRGRAPAFNDTADGDEFKREGRKEPIEILDRWSIRRLQAMKFVSGKLREDGQKLPAN
ncbi:MAG TPA: hypothetical protein VF450_00680 [Noviherbaspirillum sp.]